LDEKSPPIKTYTLAEIVNKFEGVIKSIDLRFAILASEPNAAYTCRG
jgi:hypothetical protein